MGEAVVKGAKILAKPEKPPQPQAEVGFSPILALRELALSIQMGLLAISNIDCVIPLARGNNG